MIDCTGITEGINDVHLRARAAAAADGDLQRLEALKDRGYR